MRLSIFFIPGVHYFTKHGSGEVFEDSDTEAESNDEAFTDDHNVGS